MAITYTPAETERRAAIARAEGVRLKATANAFIFRATSSQSGDFDYTVTVTPGQALDAADCTCYAGQAGKQCKHGAAAIVAVQLRTVKEAAAILARHGARKRALARAAA